MSQVPALLPGPVPADPEVVAQPERRVYTAEYKRRILAWADAAKEKGDMAQLLRREGLYSSTLASGRRERESALAKAFSQKRGPEPKHNPLAGENETLRQQNKPWEEERRQAEIIMEIPKRGDAVWQTAASDPRKRERRMGAVQDLSTSLGVKRACQALAVPRASYYRQQPRGMCPPDADRRCSSARRLREEERAAILACLHEERFQDGSPAQVYASWLDEGQYHCSLRTMYRLLAAEGENRERRDQWRRPPDAKPELLATAPHPRWSWDMTKRRGPAQWTFYDLYLILDVFSRSVTGCMIAYRESADWAQQLIEESYEKQKMVPGQRTVHADRGSSMTSQSVALLRSDLGGVKTHSRPYVSADHPYAEAPFKTLKYRPGFPDRFSSLAEARGFCQEFFPWYNHEHHPAGLNGMTPATVHYGLAEKRISASQSVLDAAYQAHPEPFVKRPPPHPAWPEAVWINPPAAKQDKTP